ncbi:MAG: glycosyl hydrolase family 18 protein [Lachnospiraceae bacterium]|nr:glycosyl hydrolase family 18 protein [Lachnospiraceae bacterium]
MKKMIPVFVAIVLIIIIGGVYAGSLVLDKYSYSKEQADLNEYFEITDETDVPIVLQNERIEERARLQDGTYYFDLATVQKYLNDRFYFDKTEKLLLYMLPTFVNRVELNSTSYETESGSEDMGFVIAFEDQDTLYIAADYVKQYTNFSYTTYADPNRMQLDTQWNERKIADISKDTAIRYQGGIKSDILTEVTKGETVEVLESMENWSKVKADGCFIGYVENKRLTNDRTEEPIPVTDYTEPEYTNLTGTSTINMAWHQVMSSVGGAAFNEALASTQSVNVISPTWFSLSSNDGAVNSLASTEYVTAAHAKNVSVWALLDNDINKLYGTDTATVLASTSIREKVIDQVVNYVNQYNIDGINLDFEQIPNDSGEDYIQFIRELSVACRKNGTVLSVDNYVPTDYTNHYNRTEQGIVADYVVIMGYDEHYAGSKEAGSVASIDYVEQGIAQTIEEGVPAEKVINGIPFYTRVWKTVNGEVTSEAVAMQTAADFIKNNSVETAWDESTCQNYGEKQIGDIFYQVWLEDAQSIETKLNIMKKYEIAGVAEWKLGLEQSSIWDIIAAYVNS